MKRVFFFACLLIAPTIALAQAESRAPCPGVDLVERMRSTDPSAFAAYEKELARIPNLNGLLWRIEKPNTPPSYLFGTMHVDDRDAMALARATDELVRHSRILLTEQGEVDAAKREQVVGETIAQGLRKKGGALAIVHDAHDLAALKKLLSAQRLSVEAADHLAPWITLMMLATPACERERLGSGLKVLDDSIVDVALAAGTPVKAIETPQEQLSVFSTMDENIIAQQLAMAARHPQIVEDGFTTILRLYREKSAGAALEALRYAFALNDAENLSNDRVFKLMIADRNVTMAARVKPELEQGGAFIAVGAAHLSGETGLVALLREAGFTVTKEW